MKFYFDPGGACAGWAAFYKGKLDSCGLSRTKAKDVGLRAAAHRECLDGLRAYDYYDSSVKSEMMWHRHRKGKKGEYIPPQDLIDTNLIAGHVGTRWVFPHDWKGKVSKKIHQPKILAALSPEELALVEAVMPPSLRHNVIDAVGIGLHDQGRLPLEAAENETCRQVKQLLKGLSATRRAKVKSAGGSGKLSSPRKKGGGKRRPRPSSFITMPKGALSKTAPTDPGQ